MKTLISFIIICLLNNLFFGQNPTVIALKKNINNNKLDVDTIYIKGSSFKEKFKIKTTTFIPVTEQTLSKDGFVINNKIWIEVKEIQNKDTLIISLNDFHCELANKSVSKMSLFGAYQYIFKRKGNQNWQFLKVVTAFS